MSAAIFKYACTGCSRTFTWKKEVAGKRGKCKCGQVITVPLHPPQDEPADDLYALAELSSDARTAAVDPAPILVPAAAVAQAASAPPLEYHRPEKAARTPRSERVDPYTGEFYDPFRDYISPAILLAAGFVGLALYMMQKMGSGPLVGLAISIAFGFMLVVTLIKTVVLTFAAFPLATYCDVSVGLLRTAVLKIAATILFGDIAILWIIVAMRSAGMIGKKDDGGPEVWLVNVVILTLLYHLCFWYMFRLSIADAKFAALMAFVSRLCNFFMTLIVIALAESIIASHAHPSASQYIPAKRAPLTISPGTPFTVQPGQTGPTAFDELISQQIKQNPFTIKEGYEWCRTGAANDADKKLVSDLYGAGADKVYVGGLSLYAQMPTDPAKRAACQAIAHAFRHDHALPDSAAANSLNYQYLVINLRGEHLQSLHKKK
jgi:hypothetical protein